MDTDKEYHFSASRLESELSGLPARGITRLIINDPEITGQKKSFLKFINMARQAAPDIFYTFYIQPDIIDTNVCRELEGLYFALQIHLPATVDKKHFAGKIAILNRVSFVFGFDLDIVAGAEDTIRCFRDRFDFAVSLYPNHIDFPLLDEQRRLHGTKFYSAQDIKVAAACAFACTVFYSVGRAVPWFISVTRPLRITPARFFADFSEWLRCNNCTGNTGFDTDACRHQEIEKMQLLFLQFKYEEKHLSHLYPVVRDIVRLNGAFSRLAGENEESELELLFNPEDLCSPGAADIVQFAETVCMERCRVKIFSATASDGSAYPDFKII